MRTLFITLFAVIGVIKVAAGPLTEVVQACTQTVHDYAVSRDALNADSYADVFAEDAVFVTPGPRHAGREALQKYIRSQPADRATMHHITTVQITPISESEATGVVYAIVQFSNKAAKGAAVLDRIANAIYYDRYVIADGRCKIKHRKLTVVMDTKLP